VAYGVWRVVCGTCVCVGVVVGGACEHVCIFRVRTFCPSLCALLTVVQQWQQ